MIRVLVLLLLMPIADYYVSPLNGSDSTGNGTLARPWKTTQHALNTITRNANGGDRINLQHGAADVLTAALSLTSYGVPALGSPLVFQGYLAAQGDGEIGEIDGAGLNGILISQPNAVTFRDLHLHDCGSASILSLNASCAVENCELDHGGLVELLGSASAVTNSYLHDISDLALDSQVSCDNLILVTKFAAVRARAIAARNRILCTGSGSGIIADNGARVDRNAIYSAGGTGTGIVPESSQNAVDVTNNLVEGFTGVGGAGIASLSGATIRCLASNRVFNCTASYSLPSPATFSTDNLTLTASPFTNPSAGDLTLNTDPNGGALCRAASYPSGFQGGPRTQWSDCGAIQSALATPPNTPTLSITDNGDGTATATVSGSTSGATNTIDVVSLGSSGSVSWTNAGSRSSDGTITLTLGNGSYLATCESSLAGLPSLPSGPYLFEMTGGAAQTTFNSPHAALAHSVQAKLISLIGTRITGIVSDSIRVRMVPYGNDFLGPNAAHELPGIIVTYVAERGLDGTNVRDDISYPIRVVFFTRTADAQNRLDLETQDDVSLTWRQTVSDVLRMQGLNVTNYAPQNPLTFYLADIDYEPQFNWPVQTNQQLAVGSVKLSFRLRKARG